MLTLLFGFVLGVVSAGLGVVTLPKLLVWVEDLKAKYFTKAPIVVTTPAPTATATQEVNK